MFKLSQQIAKLGDRWGKKLERLLDRHKGKWKLFRRQTSLPVHRQISYCKSAHFW